MTFLRSLAIAVLLALGIGALAQAQFSPPAMLSALPVATGGATYTGPGDLKTFTAWSGFRAYSAATRGTKFANVCQPAGSNCIDLNTDATTGKAPNVPTVNGAACNNSTHVCTVAELYDQTGNGNFYAQATALAQPAYNVSATGSLPCMGMTFGSTFLTMNTTPVIGQPFTISGVFDRNGNTTSQNYVLTNSGFFFYHESSVNVFDEYAGASVASVAANDSAFHAGNGVFNGASSVLYVDGTNGGAVNISTAGFVNGTTNYIAGPGGSYQGFICEVGVSASAWSGTDASNLNSNQHTFWGF